MRALNTFALLALLAGIGGCLVAAALHHIPLVLPIVIGGAIGVLVQSSAIVAGQYESDIGSEVARNVTPSASMASARTWNSRSGEPAALEFATQPAARR